MSQPALKPVSRSTVVDSVTEQLRTEILTGGFAAGARLPAERDLALQLGVNRLSLRTALGRLEAMGLIRTQHGTGSVVRDYRKEGGFETLTGLVRIARDGDPKGYIALVRDILELRRTLVCETVVLAAERHTPADLEAMRVAATEQAARVGDPLEFARGDVAFARIVVRAARNLGIELLFNTIARFPDDDPVLARAMYPRPRAQSQHYEVVIGLIASGQAAIARETMRAALEALDKITLAQLQRRTATSRRSGPNRSTSTT